MTARPTGMGSVVGLSPNKALDQAAEAAAGQRQRYAEPGRSVLDTI